MGVAAAIGGRGAAGVRKGRGGNFEGPLAPKGIWVCQWRVGTRAPWAIKRLQAHPNAPPSRQSKASPRSTGRRAGSVRVGWGGGRRDPESSETHGGRGERGRDGGGHADALDQGPKLLAPRIGSLNHQLCIQWKEWARRLGGGKCGNCCKSQKRRRTKKIKTQKESNKQKTIENRDDEGRRRFGQD